MLIILNVFSKDENDMTLQIVKEQNKGGLKKHGQKTKLPNVNKFI